MESLSFGTGKGAPLAVFVAAAVLEVSGDALKPEGHRAPVLHCSRQTSTSHISRGRP
jgi:hypothetical protein